MTAPRKPTKRTLRECWVAWHVEQIGRRATSSRRRRCSAPTGDAHLAARAMARGADTVQEALGWLAAGLTVWIDRMKDEQQPPREVVLRILRQGEAALDRLCEAHERELAEARRETWREAAAHLRTWLAAKGDAAIRRDMAIEEFERRAEQNK